MEGEQTPEISNTIDVNSVDSELVNTLKSGTYDVVSSSTTKVSVTNPALEEYLDTKLHLIREELHLYTDFKYDMLFDRIIRMQETGPSIMIDNISSVPPGSTLILKFSAYLSNESMLTYKKQIEEQTGLKVVCLGPDVDVVNYIPPEPDKEDL